jgi:hypothetical protein
VSPGKFREKTSIRPRPIPSIVFTIHFSPIIPSSTPYNLRYWQRRKKQHTNKQTRSALCNIRMKCRAVISVRRFDAGFSSLNRGFNPRSAREGSVVDKVAIRHIFFFRVFQFLLHHRSLHTLRITDPIYIYIYMPPQPACYRNFGSHLWSGIYLNSRGKSLYRDGLGCLACFHLEFAKEINTGPYFKAQPGWTYLWDHPRSRRRHQAPLLPLLPSEYETSLPTTNSEVVGLLQFHFQNKHKHQ